MRIRFARGVPATAAAVVFREVSRALRVGGGWGSVGRSSAGVLGGGVETSRAGHSPLQR